MNTSATPQQKPDTRDRGLESLHTAAAVVIAGTMIEPAADLEALFTPELHMQTTEADGWSVMCMREGRRFEYGIFTKRENQRVLVAVDPQLDEEADVFLATGGGPQKHICRALLLTILDGENPPAVLKRSLGNIHDWEPISAHFPDAPCDVYVRDTLGRHGAATRHKNGWNVYAGNADAAKLTHWAWMEPATE